MSGGGGTQNVTQTTTTNLTPEQKEILGLVMPGLRSFAANPPGFPEGPLTAPFNANQIAGQESALGAAGTQQNLATAGAGASSRMLSGEMLSPDSNPALRDWMTAATQPIQDRLLRETLPAVRSGAVAHGQFGGSRQGIAEGLASSGASQAIGATNANIANEGYKTGVDAMAKSLGLLPQTLQAQSIPATTTSGVGDVQQSLAQALLDEQVQRQMYPQLLPLLAANDLASIGNTLPGGSVSSTVTGPKQSGFGSLLRNAAGGFSLGSALFPGGVGGGAGALLGGLLSFL